MNKAELVNELAAKMNIPQYQSRQFLNAFQEVLTETLKRSPIVSFKDLYFGATTERSMVIVERT